MPIICLEGPNAAGKTTVASALAATDDAFVVPEVNVLFERPPDEPILEANEATLRARKSVDRARLRLGFETHLRFIEPQCRYFEVMQASRLTACRSTMR